MKWLIPAVLGGLVLALVVAFLRAQDVSRARDLADNAKQDESKPVAADTRSETEKPASSADAGRSSGDDVVNSRQAEGTIDKVSENKAETAETGADTTVIYRVRHHDAASLALTLEKTSPNVFERIVADKSTNSLIFPRGIRPELAAILQQLDQPVTGKREIDVSGTRRTKTTDEAGRPKNDSGREELKIFHLKNSDARVTSVLIAELYPKEFKDRMRITADERTNSVLARGPVELLQVVEAVVLALDGAPTAEQPAEHVDGAVRNDGRAAALLKALDSIERGKRLHAFEPAAEPDREASRLSQEFERQDQRAAALAREYGKMKNVVKQGSPQMQEIQTKLEGAVEAAFQARQKVQSHKLDKLRQRLAQIEARIATRDQLSKEIIQRRVDELLHPEKEWEPADQPADAGRAPRDFWQKPAQATDTTSETQRETRRTMRLTKPIDKNALPEIDPNASDEKPSSPDAWATKAASRDRWPQKSGDPRSELLGAEVEITVARAKVKQAEKSRERALEVLRRSQELYKQGALPQNILNVDDDRFAAEESRVEIAKLDLEQVQRQAAVARETLAAKVKILEIDLRDAQLRLDHASKDAARAQALNNQKAISKEEIELKNLALQQAKIQVQRAETLLELYRKALPGGTASADKKATGTIETDAKEEAP